ncbi:DsbE family thiol:disulfide interchange protein [Gilvimarinus chinensis]|uniref:DsbE family thiol:disulfide interchange protein n=1 Tax=Gilvimarinus chinensis TaxID=396005 RepID=UPI00037CE4E3|nr:DsbE family thiol:disulfide interchange protein [Gilvimarinus chinensis]
MGRLKLFLPLIILLILLPLFYVGLRLDPSAMPSALIGNPVPEFRLSKVANADEFITQADIGNRPVLLNVWATWCFACKAEHPYLNKLAEQGVRIIGVNYKDERTAAQKWLRDLHNPYLFSVYDDEGRLGLDLGVTGAPETYLVDGEGMIHYRHIGVVNDKVWNEVLGPKYRELEGL